MFVMVFAVVFLLDLDVLSVGLRLNNHGHILGRKALPRLSLVVDLALTGEDYLLGASIGGGGLDLLLSKTLLAQRIEELLVVIHDLLQTLYPVGDVECLNHEHRHVVLAFLLVAQVLIAEALQQQIN